MTGNGKPSQVRLGEVFEQSKQNALELTQVRGDVGQVRSEVGQLRNEFLGAIERLGNKLSDFQQRAADQMRPNFATMAAWASVILVAAGMIAAPLAWHFNWRQDELDVKLQNEFRLMIDEVHRAVTDLNDVSNERHADAQKAIDAQNDRLKTLEEHQWELIHDGLKELNQRREGAIKPQ